MGTGTCGTLLPLDVFIMVLLVLSVLTIWYGAAEILVWDPARDDRDLTFDIK